MRPGVPWNVKGIEAEAREAAQLAARRAGVSLGEYLSQLIMTEGRAPQPQQRRRQTADGAWGPQTQTPPQQGGFRPTIVQPGQSHGFQQGGPQANGQRDPLANAAQMLDSQIRGSEFTVVAHVLRDLAD